MEQKKLEYDMISAEEASHETGEAVTIDSKDIAKVLDQQQEQSSNLIEEYLTLKHPISTPLGETRKENSTE
jgi:regulator of RNase E activity RraB